MQRVMPGNQRIDQPADAPDTPSAHRRQQSEEPRPPCAFRHLNLKLALTTSAAAFAIAAGALTLPELIFGGALATSQETTLFGGRPEKQIKPAPVTTTYTATTTTRPTRSTATRTARSTTAATSRTETKPSVTTSSTATTTTAPQTTATTRSTTTAPATPTAH